MVVEEGLEYGPAKRRAVKQLGLNARAQLPNNDQVEDAVREYLELFCADTQPAELKALRELAAVWMARMAAFACARYPSRSCSASSSGFESHGASVFQSLRSPGGTTSVWDMIQRVFLELCPFQRATILGRMLILA